MNESYCWALSSVGQFSADSIGTRLVANQSLVFALAATNLFAPAANFAVVLKHAFFARRRVASKLDFAIVSFEAVEASASSVAIAFSIAGATLVSTSFAARAVVEKPPIIVANALTADARSMATANQVIRRGAGLGTFASVAVPIIVANTGSTLALTVAAALFITGEWAVWAFARSSVPAINAIARSVAVAFSVALD